MMTEVAELESGRRLTIEIWKADHEGEMPPIDPQLHERVARMFRRWQDATPFEGEQRDKPDETFPEALARLHVEVCHEIMHAQSDAAQGALVLTGALQGIELTPEQVIRTKAAARARIIRKIEAQELAKKSRKRKVKS